MENCKYFHFFLEEEEKGRQYSTPESREKHQKHSCFTLLWELLILFMYLYMERLICNWPSRFADATIWPRAFHRRDAFQFLFWEPGTCGFPWFFQFFHAVSCISHYSMHVCALTKHCKKKKESPWLYIVSRWCVGQCQWAAAQGHINKTLH